MEEEKVSVKILGRVSEIPRESWDGLLSPGSPFMKWDWLDCLERTGCASEKTGWAPHHVVVEKNGEIIAACPMYLKSHSMGEFVFDHEWAHYASRAGIRYYPKMLVGVPFTPVAGPRFLTKAGEDRPSLIRLIGNVLVQISKENKISSIHVNFCPPDERDGLRAIGFMPRSGLQFHWQNGGFSSFDDYLASFRSERRNKIKRERRELQQQGIIVRAAEEEEISGSLMRTMFRLYETHVRQFYYGQQYLSREFFDELSRRFRPHLCLIVAERESRVIAGTFNVQDHQALYGRYWGAFEEHRFLHFNVCYYAAIDHCIRKGLKRFEAGAGGSFKHLRGLEPEITHSVHYVLDDGFRKALKEYLREEAGHVDLKQQALSERSQLKKDS